MISSRDIFHPSHDISSPEIIRRGPPRFPGKLCAGSCSRIMLTMPLRLVLRGRRNIFYFSFYSFISLSLSSVEKIKGGWNIRKLRSQLFPRQILLPISSPAKMFPYRCVSARLLQLRKMHLNRERKPVRGLTCVHLHCYNPFSTSMADSQK